MLKEYLDPRSLTRLTGFALILAGVAGAAVPAFGSPEWAAFAASVIGDTPPAVWIANGFGLLGIRAALAKGGV